MLITMKGNATGKKEPAVQPAATWSHFIAVIIPTLHLLCYSQPILLKWIWTVITKGFKTHILQRCYCQLNPLQCTWFRDCTIVKKHHYVIINFSSFWIGEGLALISLFNVYLGHDDTTLPSILLHTSPRILGLNNTTALCLEKIKTTLSRALKKNNSHILYLPDFYFSMDKNSFVLFKVIVWAKRMKFMHVKLCHPCEINSFMETGCFLHLKID